MHGATELLVPFFLVGLGLRIDLSVFRSGSSLMLAGLILVTAILSKVIGCGLAALPLGRSEALKIGVGMIPRGEVGLVVGQLGLTIGILSQDLYDVVVFMAVATTIVSPPLIKRAFEAMHSPGTESASSLQACLED
jgi:Kef-type K+ transport system membrane component KefB